MDRMIRWIAASCLLLGTFSAWATPNDTTQKTNDTTWVWNDSPQAYMLDSLARSPYFTWYEELLDSNRIDSTRIDSIPSFDDAYYEAVLDSLDAQTPFNLVYNDRVKAFIKLYAVKRRNQTSSLLGLQAYYFPMIEEVLDQYEMPYELKYLAVIESALNPKARSKAGAVGMWQFMYTTGKMYDLHMNSYMDERMDPIKSTHAACRYLSYLYKIYDKWDLALAAYNCGPGNVNRAMRRSGSRDGNYWDLYPYLPRETRGYVPAFIAVNYVMNNAEAHNIYPTQPRITFFETDTIHLKQPMKLSYLANELGIPQDELHYLNPSYRNDFIPAYSNKTSILRLPQEYAGVFVQHENKIYADVNDTKENEGKKLKAFQEDRVVYRVRSGDYLGKIANRYHVSVSSLKRWNGLRSNNIRVGQRLIIYPKGSTYTAQKSTPKKEVKTEVKGNYEYYQIQNGDTLWDIAKAKGVSVSELQRLNRNLNSRNLKPGMKIIVGTSAG